MACWDEEDDDDDVDACVGSSKERFLRYEKSRDSRRLDWDNTLEVVFVGVSIAGYASSTPGLGHS